MEFWVTPTCQRASLRTQLIKRLTKAGIAPWARLFHSLRTSRQTELERQFPRHVVYPWLGNSSQVAERSYLLVTDEDYLAAITPEKSGAVNPKNSAATAGTKMQDNEKPLRFQGKIVFPQGMARVSKWRITDLNR